MPPYTLRCKGKIIELSSPKIMGILNTTPDSFYDGGHYTRLDAQLYRAEKLLGEGATWIDIGGMSSRPGAKEVDEAEELRRVLPLITALNKAFPEILISIDTYRAKVAAAAVEAGAAMINDISSGAFDANMIPTVGRLGVPYIMMHIKGRPTTMQQNPSYNKDIMLEISEYFVSKIAMARQYGISDLIIDPGFGFGKSLVHNYTILRRLSELSLFSLPILVGISRKSMIYRHLQITPDKALNGTTALNTLALLNGANILRVHDVKEALEIVNLLKIYK